MNAPALTPITKDQLPELLSLLTNVTNVEAASDEAWDIWWEVFRDTSYDTAVTAIKTFAKTSKHYPSPAAIREFVDDIHRERLGNLDTPQFPPDIASFNDDEAAFNEAYRRWMQAWRQQIKLGATVDQADEAALAAVGVQLDRSIDAASRTIPLPEISGGMRVITVGGAR